MLAGCSRSGMTFILPNQRQALLPGRECGSITPDPAAQGAGV